MAVFETKELQYAYSSIHDYFDIFSLSDSTAYLQKIIKAAGSSRVLEEEVPFNVIFFLQNVKDLCGLRLLLTAITPRGWKPY